jgi:hypothetical protein
MSSVVQRLVYIDGQAHWLTEEEILLHGFQVGRRRVGKIPAYCQKRPGTSLSMSVHPSQIEMVNTELRKHGITGVHYEPGRRDNCVITSRRDRARAMKVLGPMLSLGPLHDNDGGYGDG